MERELVTINRINAVLVIVVGAIGLSLFSASVGFGALLGAGVIAANFWALAALVTRLLSSAGGRRIWIALLYGVKVVMFFVVVGLIFSYVPVNIKAFLAGTAVLFAAPLFVALRLLFEGERA